MTLRQTIKELCKDRHVSMNHVEQELGFAKGYLSKLDLSKPNITNVVKLANFFQVSVDYIVRGGAPTTPEEAKKEMIERLSQYNNEILNVLEEYCALEESDQKSVRDMIEFLQDREETKENDESF